MSNKKEKEDNPVIFQMIQRQAKLVLQGKDASSLLKYLQDLQFEPTLPVIPENYIILYAGALIVGKRLDELMAFAVRNQEKLKNHAMPLYDLGKAAKNENLKQVLVEVKNYIVQSKHTFKDLFEVAVKEFIVQTISQHFLSYPVEKLKKDYDINDKFLADRGFEVSEGFVQLRFEKEDARVNQILQERMKQIISITEKVVSLQK